MTDPKTVPQVSTNVFQAISAVMRQVGYVQKSTNTQLNYSYASERGLIAALRPAMVEQELVILPVSGKIVSESEFLNRNQNRVKDITLEMTYRIAHAPSGTFVDVQIPGSAMDTGDKAIWKAITGTMKYALRQAFLIETGDDPDQDPSSEYETGSQQKQPAAAAPAQPKQTRAPAAQSGTRAPAQPKNQNQPPGKLHQPTGDDTKPAHGAAIKMYNDLVAKAKKHGIPTEQLPANVQLGVLRTMYGTLQKKVETAIVNELTP